MHTISKFRGNPLLFVCVRLFLQKKIQSQQEDLPNYKNLTCLKINIIYDFFTSFIYNIHNLHKCRNWPVGARTFSLKIYFFKNPSGLTSFFCFFFCTCQQKRAHFAMKNDFFQKTYSINFLIEVQIFNIIKKVFIRVYL